MDDQSFDKNVANENGINSMNVLLCLQAMLLLLLIKQSIRKKGNSFFFMSMNNTFVYFVDLFDLFGDRRL